MYIYIYIVVIAAPPKKGILKQRKNGDHTLANTLRSPAAGAPMARKPAITWDLCLCFIEVVLRGSFPEDLNCMLFLDLEAHRGAGFPMASSQSWKKWWKHLGLDPISCFEICMENKNLQNLQKFCRTPGRLEGLRTYRFFRLWNLASRRALQHRCNNQEIVTRVEVWMKFRQTKTFFFYLLQNTLEIFGVFRITTGFLFSTGVTNHHPALRLVCFAQRCNKFVGGPFKMPYGFPRNVFLIWHG